MCALVVLVSTTVMVGAPEASAHATLEHTEPRANAHLAGEPHQVVLRFDQQVDVALGTVTVIGPSGSNVATGYTQSDNGATVTIALRAGAGDGTYVASYRVISLDTHPISGGFFFQVGHASAEPATGSPGSGSPHATASAGSAAENTIVRAMYAAARYAGFVGLLLLVGAAVFLVALWPAGVSDRRARRLVWLGYGLLVAGSLGELVLQAPYATGVGLGGVTATSFDDVVGTRFGTAHLVRLGLLAVTAPVLVGLAARRRALTAPSAGRPARWPVLFAGPLAVGLLVTWAYSGHAGVTLPGLSVPSDVVHLAAMAVWLGGLVVLAVALLPVAQGARLHATLPRWSLVAMICVVALVVTGSVQALLEVGGWTGLVDTTYGRLLLAKIGILAVVLAVANVSRLWVRRHYLRPAAGPPRPDGESPPRSDDPSRTEIARLRQAVSVESLLGLAAVAVAAVLIEAAPGRSLLAPPPATASTAAHPITRTGAYVAAVRRGDVVIHLKVDPGVVGVQYIYLDATRPGGTPIPVRQWTLTVSNDRLGLHDVAIPVLVEIGVGHRFIYGSFTFPVGGSWTVRVIARTSDIDETVVTRTVRIPPK